MHDHDHDTGPRTPRRKPHPHERRLSMFGRSVTLPENQLLRMGLGVLLCLGGLLWFLPIVGIWMLPLGIMVLSVDIPFVRRHSRRVAVWFPLPEDFGEGLSQVSSVTPTRRASTATRHRPRRRCR